jgi:DDE superfamily endonuclease
VDKALAHARAHPDRIVLLFEDEASLYRQPSQASLYCLRGRLQPKMPCACSANTVMRVAGFLNACSGAVHFWDGSKITAGKIAKCLKEISAAYSHCDKIYIVMDNWPVHFHPKVMKVLAAEPRLEVLRLPTYAPWLNPIEKLWRLTRQRVVHAHTMSNDFNRFKQTVREFLAKPMEEPTQLLRYVGLFS